MYEQHFGLKKRPFRANAAGTDVFVGPHIAATMAGIKKALATRDAIVTVAGPVGCGKTTLVTRALESLGKNARIIHVARMRLDSNDVLEMLLDELGVEEKPGGTIQKYALFRRHLKGLADNNTRVLIAIEDGVRLGADTLAEVEALTAADAGESEGAGIVLMGDESLDVLLTESQLARAQQRIRQRYTVTPLCAAELRGYLRHCFRLAGGDFEQIFEENAADLLHHLSDGVPRVANSIVESTMTVAADQDVAEVSSLLLARVAENEYGMSAAGFDLMQKPEQVVEAPVTPAPELVAVPDPEPVTEAVLEPAPEPKLVIEAAPEAADSAPKDDQNDVEIPELIQDTLPNLDILAPQLAAIEPEQPDVPAWDRDPTLAELKPDLAALEQAMAFAQGDEEDPVVDSADPIREPESEPEPATSEEIPEITLDHAISQRIESKLIDEPGEISAPATENTAAPADGTEKPAKERPGKTDRKADAEIERIAKELAKAKSIEDVDDKLAETLFGDEINFVAAQLLANPPSAEPANEDIDDMAAEGQQVTYGTGDADIEVTLEAPKQLDDGGIDLSASQRLKTVRALNSDLHPSIREPETTTANRPTQAAPPAKTPDSIEDQINISMTQTLKALNVRPPVDDSEFHDDDESGSGFFNRFKRT